MSNEAAAARPETVEGEQAFVEHGALLEMCAAREDELLAMRAEYARRLSETEGRLAEVQLFRQVITTARPAGAGAVPAPDDKQKG